MFKRKIDQPKGLKIIIVGCGKVGTTLVDQLVAEGHDITVIDTNITKIEELTREVREHNNFAKRMPVVENEIKHLQQYHK